MQSAQGRNAAHSTRHRPLPLLLWQSKPNGHATTERGMGASLGSLAPNARVAISTLSDFLHYSQKLWISL